MEACRVQAQTDLNYDKIGCLFWKVPWCPLYKKDSFGFQSLSKILSWYWYIKNSGNIIL